VIEEDNDQLQEKREDNFVIEIEKKTKGED